MIQSDRRGGLRALQRSDAWSKDIFTYADRSFYESVETR